MEAIMNKLFRFNFTKDTAVAFYAGAGMIFLSLIMLLFGGDSFFDKAMSFILRDLLMIFGLAAMSFIKIQFAYASGTFVLALGIIGLVWYIIKERSIKSGGTLIKDLDWETIFFLIGIFVVIAAIQAVGLLDDLAAFLASLTNGSKFIGFALVLVVSIIISGFVDNVPYIMAMLPVADAMAKSMGLNGELYMFALLIGSCLGGNLTPFGASANVVAMGIVKKEGYPMNFGKWLKIGVPFTVLTTASAAAVLWLLWA